MSYYNYYGALMARSANPAHYFYTSAADQTLTGDASADYLADSYGGGALVGGTADDTFSVVDSNEVVRVTTAAAVDTIVSWTNFIAPTNIDVLELKKGGKTGVANAAGDLLISGGTDDTLVGGAGADVMVDAGFGSDYFQIRGNGGYDVIYGFAASGAGHDFIQLAAGTYTSFAQVQAHLTQQGSDVLLTLSSTSAVLIRGATVAALTAADFAFNLDLHGALPVFDAEFDSLSLYNPSTGVGVWKTNFQSGIQSGPNAYTSRTLTSGAEQEIYVDPSFAGTGSAPLGLNPFSVGNGVLTITGAKAPTADVPALSGYKYASGLLTTQKSFAQLYGYFEMRAELPAGQGVWPGFWLLPTNGAWPPEADVVEQIGGPVIFNTVHYPNSSGTAVQSVFQTYLPTNTTGFHTYGMLWTASTLSWYVDGVEVASMATPADMNTPMYMLVNLALGGNFPGQVPSSFTSAQMQVDYIRAYTLQDLGLASGTDAAIHIAGGAGNDTYYVHNSGDTISVAAGTSNESVVAVVSYALPANIQHLTVQGSGLTGTGNGLNDTLTSLGGPNTLVGGSGTDTFYVNNVGDKVVEPAGHAGDIIISSVSYGLGGDQHVLRLSGAGLTATANAAGGSYLSAMASDDKLIGSAAGGDTFTVCFSNDLVQVAAGTPGDVILAYASYTLPANVDALTAAGGGNYVLTGNGASDILTAGKGADTLTGGGGNVTFVVAPGDHLETITDFGAHGVHDQIDVSAYQAAGITWHLVQHGTATWIDFANGDITELAGVAPSSLTLSGHDLI
ncbi:family 16 glycosylhydrolase [Phenylobacterium montanum]|uniref:Family 16 glycosylhydrolase n=1 Tax=Phenylobacterium montanum TaxID=2823693 RepID=A0A975FWG8_9CAUL|nr:family 16 glycosylhydrolase [Caulobacter sp. S6]QUD86127.1 family 16 glycosylhydrolase [Caulobacter sp. S6]